MSVRLNKDEFSVFYDDKEHRIHVKPGVFCLDGHPKLISQPEGHEVTAGKDHYVFIDHASVSWGVSTEGWQSNSTSLWLIGISTTWTKNKDEDFRPNFSANNLVKKNNK